MMNGCRVYIEYRCIAAFSSKRRKLCPHYTEAMYANGSTECNNFEKDEYCLSQCARMEALKEEGLRFEGVPRA